MTQPDNKPHKIKVGIRFERVPSPEPQQYDSGNAYEDALIRYAHRMYGRDMLRDALGLPKR